jgi:hypothetical protein
MSIKDLILNQNSRSDTAEVVQNLASFKSPLVNLHLQKGQVDKQETSIVGVKLP